MIDFCISCGIKQLLTTQLLVQEIIQTVLSSYIVSVSFRSSLLLKQRETCIKVTRKVSATACIFKPVAVVQEFIDGTA